MLNLKLCSRVLNVPFNCGYLLIIFNISFSNSLSCRGGGWKRIRNFIFFFFPPAIVTKSSSQALVFHSSISTCQSIHHKMLACLRRERML